MDLTIVIALVIGMTQVIKKGTGITRRYVPLLAVGLGIVIAFLVAKEVSLEAVLGGLIAGLSSMGLYSGGKTVAGK